MNCTVTRRNWPSRINPKYDINYNFIRIKLNGKEVYRRQLNPIYDLRTHIVALHAIYPFVENIDNLVYDSSCAIQRVDSISGRPS